MTRTLPFEPNDRARASVKCECGFRDWVDLRHDKPATWECGGGCGRSYVVAGFVRMQAMHDLPQEASANKWDQRFMALAELVAAWSKDTTQVGCAIVSPDRVVLSLGYNGIPRGCDDGVPARQTRPTKYLFAEHAERNAVFNAARTGTSLKGATAYVNWCPCADCARALIQAGVARLVVRKRDQASDRWAESFAAARQMLGEAYVMIEEVP